MKDALIVIHGLVTGLILTALLSLVFDNAVGWWIIALFVTQCLAFIGLIFVFNRRN